MFTEVEATANTTMENHNIELLLLLNNTDFSKKRKRRQIDSNEQMVHVDNLHSIAEKEILRKHGIVCQTEIEKKTCNEILTKLKIIAKNDISQIENILENSMRELEIRRIQIDDSNSSVTKRQAHHLYRIHDNFERMTGERESREENHMHGYVNSVNAMPYSQSGPPLTAAGPPLTDTCMLARLLRHHYPYTHGK